MKKIALGIFLFSLALAMNSVVASANKNQPSDKVVNMLTNLAITQVPAKVKDKSGKVLTIDKKKARIPAADARRIIQVGYMSGKAQLCGEEAYQVANYQAMFRAERSKGKWNTGQLLFINKLHLMTVMMTTGQITVKEGQFTDKERSQTKKAIKDGLKKKYVKKSCSKKVVDKLKKDIEAFVDSNKS